MKKVVILSLILVCVLLMTSLAYAKKAPVISKKVFIHYPKGKLENFARKNPAKPSKPSSGKDFKYSGIHWANPTGINYYVNPANNDGVSSVAIIPAIENSFVTWESNNTSGKLDYLNAGLTDKTGLVIDGLNTVSWQGLSNNYPNAVAVTAVWYYTLSKEIIEFDLVFNDDYKWKVNPLPADPNTSLGDTTSFDVQNISTHEAGHTLMLEDLYKPPARQLTLYGYTSPGELKKISLEQGDINGLNAIYP